MTDACNLKTSGSSKLVKESGRLYRFYAFTLAASVSCAGWTTPSFGQVTTPVISPAVPSEAPDNVPPTTEEMGIPLGSFRLYPTLDIRAGYDTNVFAQPAGQQTGSGRTGTTICSISAPLARSAFTTMLRLRTIRTSVSTRTAGSTSRGTGI